MVLGDDGEHNGVGVLELYNIFVMQSYFLWERTILKCCMVISWEVRLSTVIQNLNVHAKEIPGK